MLHSKFDLDTARRLEDSVYRLDVAKAPSRMSGRPIAALMVLAIPLLLVGLLFRLLWDNLLSAGRGSAFVFKVFAEEYSRPC